MKNSITSAICLIFCSVRYVCTAQLSFESSFRAVTSKSSNTLYLIKCLHNILVLIRNFIFPHFLLYITNFIFQRLCIGLFLSNVFQSFGFHFVNQIATIILISGYRNQGSGSSNFQRSHQARNLLLIKELFV